MKLKLSVWVWSQNHLKLQLQFFAPTLQFTLKFSKSLLINNKSRWSGPQIQVKDHTQTMYYNLHVLSHFLINIFGFSCLHIFYYINKAISLKFLGFFLLTLSTYRICSSPSNFIYQMIKWNFHTLVLKLCKYLGEIHWNNNLFQLQVQQKGRKAIVFVVT